MALKLDISKAYDRVKLRIFGHGVDQDGLLSSMGGSAYDFLVLL